MRELDSLGILRSLDLVLEKIEPIKEVKRVFIDEAVGKILAEDIIATKDLPLFNNSAMDGFAFKYGSGKKLKIKKTIFAGDVVEPCLEENECYKIMTGALVPEDADTIIPFEKCKFDEEFVEIGDVKKGANLRIKGEEVKKGDILIKKGTKITFAEVAMLLSQGITNIKVYRDLKIALLVSGSELKEAFESAGEFEAYNVNYAIKHLLKQKGFEIDYLGILPDNLDKTISFFENNLNYDVIITTGGISQGEADFVIDALKELNFKKYIHGILVKPGRATLAGKLKNTLILGMPGNPLSAMVQTLSFALPILEKLRGNKDFYHKFIEVKNKIPFKVNPKKDHTVLGELKEDGFYVIDNYKYGSGMITPLLKANAIAVIKKGQQEIKDNLKCFNFK